MIFVCACTLRKFKIKDSLLLTDTMRNSGVVVMNYVEL